MRHPFEMPLLFTASLVILIIQATAQQQQVLYRGADHRNANFVKHANTKLEVIPFLRQKVKDLIECTFSCLQHAQCLSFNMAVKAVENKYDCLLLSTDKYNKSESLMLGSKNFNHHSIASPCDLFDPCNGGKCLPMYETYAHKCLCPPGLFGPHCEEKETVPSEILKNRPEYHKKLAEYLQPVQVSGKQWLRCFKASDHQYNGTAFHAACDNKGPTVTLLQAGDNVSGGYADKSWDASAAGSMPSYDAFLFSLKNSAGIAYKMSVGPGRHSWALGNRKTHGPTFGGDLQIEDNCNTNTNSVSNLGHQYKLPAGYTYGKGQTTSLMAGSRTFKCNEYEVFFQQ